MSGSANPKTCCDHECAAANSCRIGGYQCDDCGCWFCIDDMGDDGRCAECAERRREEMREEEESEVEQ